MNLRRQLSGLLTKFAQLFSTKLRDREGKVICRAFLWTWRGNLHLMGLPRDCQLKPIPCVRERVTYWRQSITWEQASAPDFPRLVNAPISDPSPVVVHIVICHLPPLATKAIYNRWKVQNPDSHILIAYGGSEGHYQNLPPSVTAVWIPDASLRTTDHARERQEYSGIFRIAKAWIEKYLPETTHVHLAEFDVIPTIHEVYIQLLNALESEDADVIGYGVLDISGTIHPHNSHELSNAEFLAFIHSISRRELKTRILTMLGSSSFWTRECFTAVASLSAPRVYLEIGMASLPHHLGYRVRPLPKEQQAFVSFEGDFSEKLEDSREKGAWLVHPCKSIWEKAAAFDSGDRKKKLLLCSHTYGAVANRAKAAALSRWFDVQVCFPDMKGLHIMGKDGSAQDGEIENSPYQTRRLARWPRASGFTKCLMRGLIHEIRDFQPDVVLCEEEPWSLARWQCRLGAWLLKKRPLFIEFTWENLPRNGWKGAILKQIYRLAVATTDGVVCGNRGAEKLFSDAGLLPAHSLRTGQLGVDPADHPLATPAQKSAWKSSLGFPVDAFVAGFCGRFIEEKGIWDLLAAVELVRNAGLPIHLVYLGAGPLEEEIRRKTLNQPWFRTLPPVTHAEVPGIICNFDLFVLPSKPQLDATKGIWEEQFGHVLIEAMMSAVPCIGSNSGGIPEVLENPQVLFNPGNIQEIADLIGHYAATEGEREKLGTAQRDRTLELWTHEAVAERYVNFISLLSAR